MAESQKRSRDFLIFCTAHLAQHLGSVFAGHVNRTGKTVCNHEGNDRAATLVTVNVHRGASGEVAAGVFRAVNVHASSMTDFLRKSTPFLRLSFFYFNA
jgi:hypothetical protein